MTESAKTALQQIRRAVASGAPRVLVVGDLMLDRYLSGHCYRVSPEAPVPVIDVQEQRTVLGGAGNVINNLGALGCRTIVASAAARTGTYQQLAELHEAAGADARCLVDDPQRRVTEKTRVVGMGQQIVRCDIESRSELSQDVQQTLLGRIDTALSEVSIVVISDYAKGVLTPTLTQRVIQLSRQRGIPVICDPKGSDWNKYRGATLVTPNREEGAQAAGARIVDEASLKETGLDIVRSFGVEWCLLTLGRDGMALVREGYFDRFAASARDVFDVTGAGDAVVAGVAAALASGVELPTACQFANIVAGIAVTKPGTARVGLDEVERALAARWSRDKITPRTEIATICADLHRRGLRVVFTNGCFDVLHAGHVANLEEAALLGDVLIVGVNSDASVRRLKPGRPLCQEVDRARVLSAMASVDYVVLFEEDDPRRLIEEVRPNVLVKGGDYEPDQVVGADLVRASGGEVRILPLVAGYSTSDLIQRLGNDS
jgi:D-beta-D-heptose 7-phosphate kinase/D-beta-D-heptose 1-phosphate adenosyltransferase